MMSFFDVEIMMDEKFIETVSITTFSIIFGGLNAFFGFMWSAKTVDFTEAELGYIYGFAMVFAILATFISEELTSRFGSANVLYTVTMAVLVAFPIMGYIDNFWILAPAMVYGSYISLATVGYSMQANSFEYKHGESIIGIVFCGVSIGAIPVLIVSETLVRLGLALDTQIIIFCAASALVASALYGNKLLIMDPKNLERESAVTSLADEESASPSEMSPLVSIASNENVKQKVIDYMGMGLLIVNVALIMLVQGVVIAFSIIFLSSSGYNAGGYLGFESVGLFVSTYYDVVVNNDWMTRKTLMVLANFLGAVGSFLVYMSGNSEGYSTNYALSVSGLSLMGIPLLLLPLSFAVGPYLKGFNNAKSSAILSGMSSFGELLAGPYVALLVTIDSLTASFLGFCILFILNCIGSLLLYSEPIKQRL